jgi:DNA-directed RNA polymerase specialized sigma24 family protein
MGRWREDAFVVSADDASVSSIEELPAPAMASPDAVLVRDEHVRLVRDALARLPDKYRLPLPAIDGYPPLHYDLERSFK